MAFVTVAHALYANEGQDPVLVETQNCIIFGSRPAGRKAANSAALVPPGTTKRVVPDETLLFQYSALGFNSSEFCARDGGVPGPGGQWRACDAAAHGISQA
jgi:3-methylfumaryl-CoA hydratase